MPELPEVETTKRGVAPHVEGKKLIGMTARRSDLRWPVPDGLGEKISGFLLRSVSRRGKYLLFHFDTGVMLVHLGMSGNLRIVSADTPVMKHDHVDWDFGHCVMRFNDPRRFGSVLWSEDPSVHPLLANLGPEPLSDEFSFEYLYAATRGRSVPIKSLIMDSGVVVGVGNIYANEALFLSGVRPGRAAKRLTRKEAQLLVENIKEVLAKAISRGGTTLRDFVGGDGKPGYFAQELYVYGREGELCKRCGKPLKAKKIAQRATVYCPACQR